MATGASLYRFLIQLYPPSFRDEYATQLSQHFDDLVADRGARAAWTRTSVDLLITAPRYRWESAMSKKSSHLPLSASPIAARRHQLATVAFLIAGLATPRRSAADT